MYEVFVIKRKQKQTSCSEKPWRYGSQCFYRELHYCLLPSKKIKTLASWYVMLDQKTKNRIALVLKNRGI